MSTTSRRQSPVTPPRAPMSPLTWCQRHLAWPWNPPRPNLQPHTSDSWESNLPIRMMVWSSLPARGVPRRSPRLLMRLWQSTSSPQNRPNNWQGRWSSCSLLCLGVWAKQPCTPSMDEQLTMMAENTLISPTLFEPPFEHWCSSFSQLHLRRSSLASPTPRQCSTRTLSFSKVRQPSVLPLSGTQRDGLLLDAWTTSMVGVMWWQWMAPPFTAMALFREQSSRPSARGELTSTSWRLRLTFWQWWKCITSSLGRCLLLSTTNLVRRHCWRATVVTPLSTTFWLCTGRWWATCSWTYTWNGSRATLTSVMLSADMTFDKHTNFGGNYGSWIAPSSSRCFCGQVLTWTMPAAWRPMIFSTELSGWNGSQCGCEMAPGFCACGCCSINTTQGKKVLALSCGEVVLTCWTELVT